MHLYQCKTPLPHIQAEVCGGRWGFALCKNTNPHLLGQLCLYNPLYNPQVLEAPANCLLNERRDFNSVIISLCTMTNPHYLGEG